MEGWKDRVNKRGNERQDDRKNSSRDIRSDKNHNISGKQTTSPKQWK
jgi:hypothetical protein